MIEQGVQVRGCTTSGAEADGLRFYQGTFNSSARQFQRGGATGDACAHNNYIRVGPDLCG